MNTVNHCKFRELTLKSLLNSRLQSAIASVNKPVSGGQDAHPTRNLNSCGTGILPVQENAAKCEFQLTKDICFTEIPLNRAKNSTRVLYVSAIALKLANNWQQTPQTIAAQLVENLQALCSGDFDIEVAPSGMIQFELTDVALAVWLQRIPSLSVGTRQCRVPTGIDRSGAYFINVESALSNSAEEMLFPIQYSHARCCSLLRMAHRDRLISIVEFDATRACFQTFRSDSDPPKSPLKRGTLSEFSPLGKGGWGGSPGLKTHTTTPQIWSLVAPNPIPWLDGEKLRLVHPAESNLISQLFTVLDTLSPILEAENCEKPVDSFKLANNLSAAFQTFYSQCRIWGEVKIETPKLAQARLGLVLATQSLLRFMLEDLLNAVAPLEL